MSDFVRSPRPITLRVRRDTIALVAVAFGLTGALASVIHAQRSGTSASASVWTGELSEAPVESVPASKPVITSASLVVAPAELALPKTSTPATHPRAKVCDGISCPSKAATAAPLPAARRVAALEPVTPSIRNVVSDEAVELVPRPPANVGPARPGIMTRLNPLRHFPDVSIVRRPLAAADETISGWFKRF